MNDVEGFEVNPKRVRGIGEAAVREGVGSKQITEFVVRARRGNSARDELYDSRNER